MRVCYVEVGVLSRNHAELSVCVSLAGRNEPLCVYVFVSEQVRESESALISLAVQIDCHIRAHLTNLSHDTHLLALSLVVGYSVKPNSRI